MVFVGQGVRCLYSSLSPTILGSVLEMLQPGWAVAGPWEQRGQAVPSSSHADSG